MTRALEGGGAAQSVRLRAGLVYGYSNSDTQYAQDQAVPTEDYRLDLHLATLLVGADLPTGTGLGAVLPWGYVTRKDAGRPETTDTGLGDLELRLRQDVMSLFELGGRGWPRLVLSAGAVAPTGPYIAKQTAVSGNGPVLPASDKYVSLGRGVWWLLADAELFGAIGERLGWYAGLWTRRALTEAVNGFDWGPEARTSVGASYRVLPGRLSAALAVDWQWRGRSTEIVYNPLIEKEERTTFISGGGDWYDVVPSVRAEWTPQWSTSLTVRVPVYRKVHGLQGVQNTGVFLGLQYAFAAGSPAPVGRSGPEPHRIGEPPPNPEIAALLVPGRFTLVDYQADWCAPCKDLSAQLDAWAPSRPDVAIAKVDATAWLQAEMDRFLPAIAGLPVLDVYDPQGRLVARLVGPETFAWRQSVPAPPASHGTPDAVGGP